MYYIYGMKTCYKCKQPHTGNHSYCTSCRKKVDAEYNKRRDKAKKYAKVNLKRKANQKYILSYLLEHPCTHCGEADPIVLDFHHLRDKKKNIADMLSSYSLNTITKEIAKCEVLCANCHRRVTYYQRKNQQ